MRDPISVERRVAVTLWRLATGDTFRATGLQFGIARSTACKIKNEVCFVLARMASRFIKFPVNEGECQRSMDLFQLRSDFPQVVGAIDGSHIPLKRVPKNKRQDYFNRKQDYSIVMQGGADATYKFIDISVGYPGSIHDARIMRLSKLHKNIVQGKWLSSGPKRRISGVEVGPLLLGDSAYPIAPWLMKPFRRTPTLTEEQVNFNRNLSKARVAVEQAFGILKGRWRCLLKPLDEGISNAVITTTACCVLHNLCIDARDPNQIIPAEENEEPPVNFCPEARPGGAAVLDAVFSFLNNRPAQ